MRAGRHRGARTLGLVLSGGGARGAFQVGVYERLLEDVRFAMGPTVLSGTSAGGINAALIAAGKSPREMLAFWKAIADDPPVTASDAFFDGALLTFVRLTLEESARWLRSTLPEWALAPLQLVGMTATEIKALMNDLSEAERQSGLDEVERELDQLDQNIEELENLLLTTPAHTMDGIQAVLDMAVARFREQTVTDPNDVFYDYGDARTLRFLERAADDLRMLVQETHRVAS